MVQPEGLTAYGFAKATLVSLWYARNSAGKLDSISPDPLCDGATWRIVKRTFDMSTSDLICAKEPVQEFWSDEAGNDLSTVAKLLATTYDGLISVNQRQMDFIEKRHTLAVRNKDLYLQQFLEHIQEEMNAMLAIQFERRDRWNDLGMQAERAVVFLFDLQRRDEQGVAGLSMTKAQKETLLNWANEHFSEFTDGSPKDKWTEPAKIAHTYVEQFEGRKCIDE